MISHQQRLQKRKLPLGTKFFLLAAFLFLAIVIITLKEGSAESQITGFSLLQGDLSPSEKTGSSFILFFIIYIITCTFTFLHKLIQKKREEYLHEEMISGLIKKHSSRTNTKQEYYQKSKPVEERINSIHAKLEQLREL